MTIRPLMESGEFYGIQAMMHFPYMYIGSGKMYYVDTDAGKMFRVTEELYEHMGDC